MFTQFEANLNTFAPLERSACDSCVYQGLQAALLSFIKIANHRVNISTLLQLSVEHSRPICISHTHPVCQRPCPALHPIHTRLKPSQTGRH